MYIERKLEKKIRKYLDAPEMIAVVGPRQSGKTTLVKKIFDDLENAIFLSFEDISLRSMFDEDPDSFYSLYITPYKYICIDEFQYSKAGGQRLKYIYDTFKGKKIFVTGSSSIDLTVKTLGLLVGRIFVFRLLPFSFEEFLSYKNRDLLHLIEENPEKIMTEGLHRSVQDQFSQLFKEFVIYGGFPRVVLSGDAEEKREVLSNLVLTFIMRDVKNFVQLREDYKFNKLIKALSFQVGNLISYNELSRLCELAYPSVKSYLNILEKTFIIKLIFPFYTNKRAELTKSPKVYFMDQGLRNEVAANFLLPDERGDKGALFENYLLSELMKADILPNFWRTKADAEVDFVWEMGSTRIAVEAKSKLKSPIIPRALRNYIDKYHPDKIFILNENLLHKENNIVYIPYYLTPIFTKQFT